MHHALNWLWQGLVVALATFVALRALQRARPHARCVLCWSAVIATVILPLLPLMSGWLSGDAPAATRLSSGGTAPLAIPQLWWTSTAVVLLAWTGWAGLYGARLVSAVRRLREVRGRSRPFPAELEARLACWMTVRTRGRRARLVLADDVGAAAVLGCGAPLIAVAPHLLDRLDADEIDRVLVHEWAHVQRRDDLLQLADAAVRVAAGWHPAVYWLLRQLALEREAACDAVAVDVTGCPRHYAASLAAVASARSKQRRLAIAAAVLSAPPLRVRVTRILSMQQLASTRLSAAAVAAGVLVIGVLTSEIAARPLIHARATDLFEVNPLPDSRRDRPIMPPIASAMADAASLTPRMEPRRTPERAAAPIAASVAIPVLVETPLGIETPQAAIVSDHSTEEPMSQPSDAADPGTAPPVTAPAEIATAPAAASPEATSDKPDPAPWVVASTAAVALARGSERAATATSTFFSRAGRRLASTF